MIVYTDTSALVKLLLVEAGSETMREVYGSAERITSSSITYVELRAATAAAHRDGRVPSSEWEDVLAQLESLWNRIAPVPIDESLLRAAGNFAESQALRGYDAIQLAALAEFPPGDDQAFACWDSRLRTAAQRLGYTLIPS